MYTVKNVLSSLSQKTAQSALLTDEIEKSADHLYKAARLHNVGCKPCMLAHYEVMVPLDC
jgi:hypothetical protein